MNLITSLDPKVISALIAGFISVIGILVTLVINLIQLRQKSREITNEIKLFHQNFQKIKQDQVNALILKRLDVYPKLWKIITEFTVSWECQNKLVDSEWAIEFLEKLNMCNEEIGCYFSESLYMKFAELRIVLFEITKKARNNEDLINEDIREINRIISGYENELGLSTMLKDDLGSYTNIFVTERNSNS